MYEIQKYFSQLTQRQVEQVGVMLELYPQWNEKINVVSRRDIQNLAVHHILHSLSIAKFMTPKDGSTLMDLGCGGGFPGIPLAMMWPGCRFHLIDRVAKKLNVAQAVAEAMGLDNVTFQHGDSGECHLKFDYVVSRAVMPLPDLVKACRRNIAPKGRNRLPNGLICLKGGDLQAETEAVRMPMIRVPLSDYFNEEYFREKELIYMEL